MENAFRIKDDLLMKRQSNENKILYQIAALLVREKFLSPEEHLRFLSLLEEEASWAIK